MRTHSKRGFTFVEMLIVIVTVACLALLVVPQLIEAECKGKAAREMALLSARPILKPLSRENVSAKVLREGGYIQVPDIAARPIIYFWPASKGNLPEAKIGEIVTDAMKLFRNNSFGISIDKDKEGWTVIAWTQ